MPDPQFRVAEIEVHQSTVDEKILGIFRYDSESHTRGSHYTILVLAEIGSTLYAYEQLLDTINGTIEQVRHLVAGTDADPVGRFEKLTGKINDAVAAFCAQEPTPIGWPRVNLFILQLCDEHLCLSGIGGLTNLFLQKQKDGTYRTFDLLGSLEQPADVDPNKPLASLICGDMRAGDILFAGTTNFQHRLVDLNVEERLKTLPPVTAAMEIKQALEDAHIPDDYTAVIVAGVQLNEPTPIVPVKEGPAPKPRSTESVDRLNEELDKTEAMLSPTIAPLPRNREGLHADPEQLEISAPPPIASQAPRLKKFDIRGWIAGLMPKRRPRSEPITTTSLRGMHAGHGSFFTRKRKIQLIVIGAILLTAIAGIVWFQRQSAFSKQQTVWNTIFDQATAKRTQAEADLVYGNEDRAHALITEAEALVAQLDDATPDRKKAKADLLKSFEDFQSKFRRQIVVEQPDVVFTFPSSNETPATIRQLVFYRDHLLAVEDADHAIANIDPGTKGNTAIALTGTSTILYAGASKDAALFVTDRRSVYSIDPGLTKASRLTLSMTRATGTRAIALYGKRLYLLDPFENMIWKYTGSASGYGQEATYLKQNTRSLSDATSVAVDSNVYVGFADGTVMRYLSGAEEPWQMSPIDPALQHVAALWTTPDTDRLVIADTAGQRILVFRKDGRLVAQISSPAMRHLSTITGDDVRKKIYAADGNQILGFDLP